MSDSDSSGPSRDNGPVSDGAGRGSSPKAYSSYQPAPSPIRKTKLGIGLWLVLAIVAGLAFKHFTHVSAAPQTAVITDTAATSVAVNNPLELQMLDDFSHYMTVAERTADDASVPIAEQNVANPTHPLESLPDRSAAPEAKQAEAKLAASVQAYSASDSNFISLVSRCYIDGHDLHFITNDGKILSHVAVGTPLVSQLARAREIINLNPHAGLRIMVYKDKIMIIGSNGKLVSAEVFKDPAAKSAL
jgi:hypothetical protein